jgi:hypothetical protein
MDEFNIDIGELDYSRTADRKLIKLFEYYFHLNKRIENPEQATKELIETYMAVVRSHNNLRRNWHPRQSLTCDTQVLNCLSKMELDDLIIRKMNDAMTVTSNGEKIILEHAIKEIANRIVNEAYPSKKGSNYSPLEAIVREILRIMPKATYRDVIYELDSKHNEYGIVYMDTEKIIIEFEASKGHRTKEWKLSRIKNILTNIRNSPPE